MTVTRLTAPAMPWRVLLVDDDIDARALQQRAMSKTTDFSVVGQAHDGLEGVAVARRVQPDVILLDVMMPVMDGLVALPLIKGASPSSRIIMLSSLPATRMVDACIEAGATGFVQKSHALSETLDRVRDALRCEEPELN